MGPYGIVMGSHNALFTFRYSPLGLPSHNLMCLGMAWPPHRPPPRSQCSSPSWQKAPANGRLLRLVEHAGETGWEVIPWTPHLWWLRFLVAARECTADRGG